ncbi:MULTISPECIES: transposase family protein [unclassified Streptomyces]|uniref:transposase family protein n=1 Tax=unclassified Streptomyces TaxID=2593676 RepID=UPI00352DD6F9
MCGPPGRDAGISQATGYRILHESVDVLAVQAPDLVEVLEQCRREGVPFVILDGTLIRCDRGDRTRHRSLVFDPDQALCREHAVPRRARRHTPVGVRRRTGSVHDLAAARIHAQPDLYQTARDGLPTLAEIGYLGAGAGVHVPFRKYPDLPGDLGVTNQTYNRLLRGLRFLGERAMAELKQRWRTLQYVTLRGPNKGVGRGGG